MRMRMAILATTAAAAVLVTAGAFADRGREQIRYNAADQAAARATILRRFDFSPSTGWTGGRVKPDLSPAPTCPNYHPKQSDLVLTGAAESRYRRGAVVIGNEVQVMKTRRMVSLDWQREVLAPGTISCQRRDLARSLGSSAKVVSFRRVPFPRIARYTAEFRAFVDVSVLGGRTVHLVVDAVLVGRGRSEISMTTLAPASATASLTAAERRLARKIVARARA
jgi:hypothetical protein